jgi:hypothetical protein
MSECNLALNANINGKEQPNKLYVHGSVMVYSANDQVVIKEANPQGINDRILLLNLDIIEVPGPMKGVCKPYVYEKEVNGQQYDQVTVMNGDESTTVDVQYFG